MTLATAILVRLPRAVVALVFACLGEAAVAPATVWAQSPAPPIDAAPNQDDPTKAVFFNIRNEFFDLQGEAWTNAVIARSDRALLRTRPRLGGKVAILTRFDVPLVSADSGDARRSGSGTSMARRQSCLG